MGRDIILEEPQPSRPVGARNKKGNNLFDFELGFASLLDKDRKDKESFSSISDVSIEASKHNSRDRKASKEIPKPAKSPGAMNKTSAINLIPTLGLKNLAAGDANTSQRFLNG